MKSSFTLQERKNRELKFIYLYSENFNYYDFSKIKDDKGEVFVKILGNDLKYSENLFFANDFVQMLEKAKFILRDLINENEMNPMEYPYNLSSFEYDMFIEKEVLGKKIKLFQGGIENVIIGLSNLYDLLEKAIENKNKFIRILCFYNHKEHRDWVSKNSPSYR